MVSAVSVRSYTATSSARPAVSWIVWLPLRTCHGGVGAVAMVAAARWIRSPSR